MDRAGIDVAFEGKSVFDARIEAVVFVSNDDTGSKSSNDVIDLAENRPVPALDQLL